MQMNIAFVHFITDNTGDIMSAPYRYFAMGGQPPLARVAPTAFHIARPVPGPWEGGKWDAVIYGGGALAGRLLRGEHMAVRAKKRIAWGIGRSVHGAEDAGRMPDGFDLLGVREWTNPQRGEYVPCASCMHPQFDILAGSAPTREAVLFVNGSTTIGAKYPTRVSEPLPTMTNRQPVDSILSFLASAETVVTNSYHGAYWGTLLGRKVVLAGAYSSKFHAFKFPPVLTYDGNWREAVKAARTYPEALQDSRRYSTLFAARVRDLLED